MNKYTKQKLDVVGGKKVPQRRPRYDRYHPLWHLQRIGMSPSFVPASGPQTRVALIDTGVTLNHPYLNGRLDLALSIDFGAMPYGLRYCDGQAHVCLEFDDDLLDQLSLRNSKGVIAAILTEAQGKTVTPADRSTLQLRFSSHGTSVAGLIVGFPPIHGLDTDPRSFLYIGVDPQSSLISVATSLDPSPRQLILALLYAMQNCADVIFIPRGISADWKTKPATELPEEDRKAWQGLEDLLIAVSALVPVVCAAGNSGEDVLAYPAALSGASDNNGIIAVGAATYLSHRSSYSNYGAGLTLVAPSDDAEVLNRNQVRLDKFSHRYRLHQYSAYEGRNEIPYSHQSILALDIPGRAGYAGGVQTGLDEDDPVNEWFDPTRGAFALFGGTSAASAIVAGVAAQVVRKAKGIQGLQLDGPRIKEILARTSVMEGPLEDGSKWVLLPDNINGNLAPDDPGNMRLLFGNGMVNLPAALDAVERIPISTA